jgi:hypothetical protein
MQPRQNNLVKHGQHIFFFSYGSTALYGPGPPRFVRFHGHTHLRHTTVGRTPLDEGPARRRDLYLTTHNTHKRQTSMPPLGFEPTVLVSERPKTHALDRTATGIGGQHILPVSYLYDTFKYNSQTVAKYRLYTCYIQQAADVQLLS